MLLSRSNLRYIYRDVQAFVDKNISVVQLGPDDYGQFADEQHFDAFVVGSDQVWRPRYNDSLYINYLGFVKSGRTKKISYAASFGVDNWEYTPEETALCKALAGRFNAISVREKSGIDLCDKYFNTKACQVLDPTMLLRREDYVGLCDKNKIHSDNTLFVYLLDDTQEKRQIAEDIARKMQLEMYYFMPETKLNHICNEADLQKASFKSIEDWLLGFCNCRYVLCDSFHGTVFSILFNKPFSVISNGKRGNTRFDSLLSVFNLQDRLVNDINDTHNCITDIDWENVNPILEHQRTISLNFLKSNLYVAN